MDVDTKPINGNELGKKFGQTFNETSFGFPFAPSSGFFKYRDENDRLSFETKSRKFPEFIPYTMFVQVESLSD